MVKKISKPGDDKTIWIIIGVCVLIAIIVIVYLMTRPTEEIVEEDMFIRTTPPPVPPNLSGPPPAPSFPPSAPSPSGPPGPSGSPPAPSFPPVVPSQPPGPSGSPSSPSQSPGPSRFEPSPAPVPFRSRVITNGFTIVTTFTLPTNGVNVKVQARDQADFSLVYVGFINGSNQGISVPDGLNFLTTTPPNLFDRQLYSHILVDDLYLLEIDRLRFVGPPDSNQPQNTIDCFNVDEFNNKINFPFTFNNKINFPFTFIIVSKLEFGNFNGNTVSSIVPGTPPTVSSIVPGTPPTGPLVPGTPPTGPLVPGSLGVCPGGGSQQISESQYVVDIDPPGVPRGTYMSSGDSWVAWNNWKACGSSARIELENDNDIFNLNTFTDFVGSDGFVYKKFQSDPITGEDSDDNNHVTFYS